MSRYRIIGVAFAALVPLLIVVTLQQDSDPSFFSEPWEVASDLGIDEAMIEAIQNYRSTGDLDAILRFRFLRLLVVYSKTFYFIDKTSERGAIYEYAKLFESFLNRKLRTGRFPLHVVFLPVQSDQLLPYLIEGRGDVVASDLTITPERKKIVDFTTPINVGEGFSELVVTGPGAPPLLSLDDLGGKEVYVRKSSSYYSTLRRWNKKLRMRLRAPIVIKEADENLEDEDILELVNAGVVEITVVDSYLAEFWADIYDRIRVREDLVLKTDDHIGWAVRKDNPKLARLLNEFISSHPITSVETDPILKLYLMENRWVRNPASAQERRKFDKVVDVFKKYGARYNLDYLLIAAQAYQESGLNQGRRSPRGAVGIMQVMPKTAAGSPINIRHMEILDNNVHAGVKYLRYFIDNYFSDEAITPINKALFALASYNAGPSRISSLRRKAAAEGLDPNRWFDNVERVVAREVGRETVTYVLNIFKYFVAFNLIEERQMKRQEAMANEKAKRQKQGAQPAQPVPAPKRTPGTPVPNRHR